jgi:hypothetical protein
MIINRIKVFRALTITSDGDVNEELFSSLMEDNYNNFKSFCKKLDEIENPITTLNCALNKDSRKIVFSYNSTSTEYEY